MNSNWTKDWPTKAGTYWFYGWAFMLKRRREGNPRLSLVRVRASAKPDVMVCIGEGNFFYEAESDGVWLPATLPELPAEL